VAPVAARLAADPNAVGERAWLLVAALTGALVEVGGTGTVLAGASGDNLALEVPGDPAEAELVPLAFDGQVAGIDRLRARALAFPAFVLDDVADLKAPIGIAHPLVVAAAVAGLVARRILQRLNGMGKWGGYHTEFAHLARGFAGNDRKLAEAVGEAMLEAGLLAEKPS